MSFHSRFTIPRRAPAFTLIEVLAVIVIVAGLMVVTAPAIQGAMKASRLRDAADLAFNQIAEAQQLALMADTETEVRIYAAKDIVSPESLPQLRKIELYALRPSADGSGNDQNFEPVGRGVTLHPSMIISREAKHTSLISLGFQSDERANKGQYLAFRFHPDGSTNLGAGQEWFLTVVDEQATALKRHTNFITVQVDPVTGRLRTFQPGA
jgi:uncharacterized protein (TIGR02596 family)